MGLLTVSDVADAINRAHGTRIEPRTLTLLFYQKRLREDLCPLIRGRRMIPADYLPMIEAELRRRGKLRGAVA